MWAGTAATYHRPIHVGEIIKNVTTIESVTPKTGKTGNLVFLKLKHEIFGENGIGKLNFATVNEYDTYEIDLINVD